MFKILQSQLLAKNIHELVVEAPRIARHCMPGQFLIVIKDEKSERIPLTISNYDREKGTVTIVFQPVGASTLNLTSLKEGDYIAHIVGPLGNPSALCNMSIDELKKKKIIFMSTALKPMRLSVQNQKI